MQVTTRYLAIVRRNINLTDIRRLVGSIALLRPKLDSPDRSAVLTVLQPHLRAGV